MRSLETGVREYVIQTVQNIIYLLMQAMELENT